MRPMRPVVATLAAACLAGSLSGTARATQNEDFDFDTTEDLYQVCASPADAPDHTLATFSCRAFIEATVQYHDEVTGRKGLKRLICYGKDATIADGQRTFVAWGKAHLDDTKLMSEVPVIGVVRALAAKYPCK